MGSDNGLRGNIGAFRLILGAIAAVAAIALLMMFQAGDTKQPLEGESLPNAPGVAR